MSEYTRTINILSYNLGAEDATFLLTFDSETTPGIFKSVFPTAWKVVEFPNAGGYMFTATFKSQLGFIRAQRRDASDNVVSPPLAYIPIKNRQQTILTKKKNAYVFSTPTEGKKDMIKATNGTDDNEDIGVGFFADEVDYPPTTILYFKDVGPGSSVHVDMEFKPILRGYIVPDTPQNRILTSQISSDALLFDHDLTTLDDETYWRITYDKTKKTYKIEPDVRYKTWKSDAGYDD